MDTKCLIFKIFSPLCDETRAFGNLFELASTIRILSVFGRIL